MEEIYRKLSSVNLWQGLEYSNETSFDVMEAWLSHKSGKPKISINRRVVHFKELDSWLAEESKDDGDEKQILVLRLALIGCDLASKKLKLSKDVLDTLLDEFNLELAYTYSQSCITNVSAIPFKGCQTYSFCYMPKLVAIWAQQCFEPKDLTDRAYLTQGLIFVKESNKEDLSEFLCSPWNALLYYNPMFPAFILSIILSMQIHHEEAHIKLRIREAEERTGQDRAKLHKMEEATTESYIKLAAKMDRHAVKLASVSRKSKMAEKTLNFILNNMLEQNSLITAVPIISSSAKGRELLRSHVLLLQDRLAMQAVDIEFTLKRVQLQINTYLLLTFGKLAGIISRDDVKANLDLAESQHRDSLSMKTLAIVTMLFLPGSFISALFSTSMFDWDSVDPSSNSIAVRTMPQFGLYWAITIPLTVVTFLLYFFWLRMMKQRRDHKKHTSNQLSAEEKGETDKYRLANTRKDTSFTKKSALSFGSF
ncbi:hypothetical protein TARUN_3798 [Trichoderma arundinaceum]|uniref:Uncharacterized protein n=1 Tax=Trichoderma arundinaceum TaxID=490622 RepID=A0A395NQT3_TRIAR|nr:hypothetical protein TARUN_3798 [Trichoderma arundinaceum]